MNISDPLKEGPIERLRLALRAWANRRTARELNEAFWQERRDWHAHKRGAEEVASWRFDWQSMREEAIPSAPTDKMQLGNHAKRLLDDPVMRLAFEYVTADLMKTWRETGAEEREKREDAYRMLRGLDSVEFKLRRFAGNAALIAAERQRKEEAQSRS